MGDSFTAADAYLHALTQWGQAAWLASVYRADIHFDGLDNLRTGIDACGRVPRSARRSIPKGSSRTRHQDSGTTGGASL
ncbi:hypothetical protein [Variovorax sp.]|uniref:hypothetical protein n=1 Tax=Variovorax sp. TaxID=1871043 RepID=UPI003BAB5606